jgi:hypothetical protein
MCSSPRRVLHENALQDLANAVPRWLKWGTKQGCKKNSARKFLHVIDEQHGGDTRDITSHYSRHETHRGTVIVPRPPLTEALKEFLQGQNKPQTLVAGAIG